MKTLYIDCNMGAAGDMLTAALLELVPEPDRIIGKFNLLGIPGVVFSRENSVKCGITGTHISVKVNGQEESSEDHHHDHEHEHHHSGIQDIDAIVRGQLPVSEQVKNDIMAVYSLIAEAESNVHGVPVNDIHFHEVGTMDAIADIAAVCILMEMISPDRVVVSPIHVGSGQVKCAHGILPVPAPATAYILRDVPIYGGSIQGELCTPTGAALLKHFATDFGSMPVMTVRSIGYGMGMKDFIAANCVRAILGETPETSDIETSDPETIDTVLELSCNIDDMTPEAVGFAMEVLLSAGALDVYTIPIGMKKSRPGILLCTMCRINDKDKIIRTVFKHTTTIGIREQICNRYILHRTIEEIETRYGTVHKKISDGYGVKREKYEYEDISEISRKRDLSISEVLSSIQE